METFDHWSCVEKISTSIPKGRSSDLKIISYNMSNFSKLSIMAGQSTPTKQI